MDFKQIEFPSERIKRMRANFLKHEPQLCTQRAEIVTEVFQQNENLPIMLLRAKAFKTCCAKMDLFIEDGELLLGHHASKPRSAEFYPEQSFNWYKDLDTLETRPSNRLKTSEEVKKTVRELYQYWHGKGVRELFDSLRLPEMFAFEEVGLKSVVGHEGGLGHVVIEYDKLIKLGTSGIREEVAEYRKALSINQSDFYERKAFYDACEEILDGLEIYADRMSALAREEANKATDDIRKNELINIAWMLKRVPRNPAKTFWEALQSLTILHLLTGTEAHNYSMSPSRFDQYLYPYLKDDLCHDRIDIPKAQELVDDFFLRTCEVIHVSDNETADFIAGYPMGELVCVGGVDKEGNDATNELSYMCLAANKHIALNQPNFAARLHSGMPDEYVEKVIESISAGNGMPEILNDDCIIESLLRKGIPLETARDYWPLGCDEITVKGHWGRCNGGYVNFQKVLEVTIGDGTDLLFGKKVGLGLNVDACETFDEFMECFYKQLEETVRLQCADTNLADFAHRCRSPLPLVSTFVDGCLQRGRDVTDSGAFLNSTTIVGLGSANCFDGLYAIKKVVYENHEFTLAEFREILKKNFEGNEVLRQRLINKLPKFGNDVDEVDVFGKLVTDRFYQELEKYETFHKGKFWPALYSVTAQVPMGLLCAAGPDGRLAKEPLADGYTPMYGQDKNGPTAAMMSFTKSDLAGAPGGVIINQRFTASVFSEQNKKKLVSLLRAFVARKGFHWQFNIVSTEVMRAAQKNPAAYRDLVVRVAGYSAIFIELSEATQESVIKRTEASI